jgi:hypothetical protein
MGVEGVGASTTGIAGERSTGSCVATTATATGSTNVFSVKITN